MDNSCAEPPHSLICMDIGNFYKNKKVVITGAGGQIGSLLARRMSAFGGPLKLIFRSVSGAAPEKAEVFVLDLRARDIWGDIVSGADIVFHLAAHESKNFELETDLEVNARSVLYLLEACRKQKKPPHIVFASSSNVVGAPSKMPVDESFKDNPLTIYAIHKLMAEEYLKFYADNFGIPSITLRLANVYGPSTSFELSLRSSLNKMINSAARNSTLALFANKDKTRDFLHIDDAVDAFVAAGAVNHPLGEVCIVGSERGETFEKIAEMITDAVKRFGREVAVSVDESSPLSAAEMREFIADSSKFRKLTSWKPQVKLEDGIAMTADYFIKQRS